MRMKRLISLLLTFCLMVGVLPVASLAVDTSVLHNCNVPEGYHLFTDLPTEENPVTTETLYWGNAFGSVFYGMNSTFTTASDKKNSSATTTTDVATMNTITIRYGGKHETYGDYYHLIFTLANGTSYTVAYSGGYYTQNQLTDGLPSDGWQHKHKLFYDAEQHIFFHRPSNSLTTMKAPVISAASQKFFTNNAVSKVLSDGNYPVRLYTTCTSDNVAGKNDTHQWSGSCKYEGCDTKFDYTLNDVADYVVETRAPQAGTPYFWGVTQLDIEGKPSYFFNGEKLSSTFNTQTDMLTGTPVYVDAVEGGYKLYFLNANSEKQYICLGKDASNNYSTFIAIETDAAKASVFTWNKTYNTFVTEVVKNAAGDTVDMVLGAYTSGSTKYTKISALTLGHLAQDHYFPSQLYVKHTTHQYDGWGYDENNHWSSCFCGSNQDAQPHMLGDPVVEDGKIYKKCICGYARQEGTVPSVDSYSISLKDNFAINFFVKKATFDSGLYTNPYMVCVINGHEIQITDYKTQDDCYVFTFDNLASDMMNKTVTANLYATFQQNPVLVSTGTYSVAQYCYAALRDEAAGDALRKLLVETLNFGAAANQYRGNAAGEDFVNAGLTEEEKALGSTGDLRALTNVKNMKKTAENPAAYWHGASLVMGNAVRMRLYFRVGDIAGLTVRAVSASGSQWTLGEEDIMAKDGMFCVTFGYLSPAQMGEAVGFTIYNGETPISDTFYYSVESYAAVMLNKTDASQQLKNLLDAMIRYGDAAEGYANRAYNLQEDVLYLGRVYESDNTQWFNWSASGFSVQFQGSGLKAKIASNAPNATNYAYLKVYVDGVEQPDILLDKTLQTVILAEGLNPDEIHTVEVRKRNSPRSSTAGVLSMEVLDGKKLAPLDAKDKLIEFVGDSLTVGYSAADVNKTESGWSTKTEDATKTYSKQVADAFDAEYMVTAISGRGVVMNNGGASGYLFPEIYPELDIYNTPGTAYDFALQPDVVVINLGTNDATNAGLNITTFQTGVYDFIKTVRGKNPNAQIIWAYGLRSDKMTGQVAAAIEAAVAQIKAEGDSMVHYLPLALAADMHLNHPTAAAYAPSGEKLIEKIEEITGW